MLAIFFRKRKKKKKISNSLDAIIHRVFLFIHKNPEFDD